MDQPPMDERIGADELRARRRGLGVSQAALAAVLDVSANTVARWERGEVSPRDAGRIRRTLDELRRGAPSAGVEPAARPTSSLPRQLTSFVGRATEVADVQRL